MKLAKTTCIPQSFSFLSRCHQKLLDSCPLDRHLAIPGLGKANPRISQRGTGRNQISQTCRESVALKGQEVRLTLKNLVRLANAPGTDGGAVDAQERVGYLALTVPHESYLSVAAFEEKLGL